MSECRTIVLSLVRNFPKIARSSGVASPRIERASGACVAIITLSKISTLPFSKTTESFTPSVDERLLTGVDLCNHLAGIPSRIAST